MTAPTAMSRPDGGPVEHADPGQPAHRRGHLGVPGRVGDEQPLRVRPDDAGAGQRLIHRRGQVDQDGDRTGAGQVLADAGDAHGQFRVRQ
jgi:hypothetical protein